MTLFRQLVLAITFIIMFLLAANMVVTVNNSRLYLFEQLQVQTEQTATSVAFSISQVAEQKDLVQMRSMIDVIFDHGYYRDVIYRDLEGNNLVERHRDDGVEGVPGWFVEFVQLPLPLGQAEVVSGWYRLGQLIVVGHQGFAYRDLWRVFKQQLWLFMAAGLLCYILAGIAIRYLLKPLERVEAQADAICRKDFSVQDAMPKTRELRRVVLAMNRMVAKLKDMFQEQVQVSEQLRQRAHLDSVTQLANRRDFDARYQALIKENQGHGGGVLVLMQLDDLLNYNQMFGREAGDAYLQRVAKALQAEFEALRGAIISRRSGADFCVFAPGLDGGEAERLVKRVKARLQGDSWMQTTQMLPMAFGIVSASEAPALPDFLGAADQALSQAQAQADDQIQCVTLKAEADRGLQSMGAGQWRDFLEQALAQKKVRLHFQGVFLCASKALDHAEVLCRLEHEGSLLVAGEFFPMVERLGLSADFDQAVLERLRDQFHTGQLQVDPCVNLSPNSVNQPDFVAWLDAFLVQEPALARRLIFELPESLMQSSQAELRQLSRRWTALGVSLSLDHFGVGRMGFGYLHSENVRCLKLDPSFVQALDEQQDNQFFIRSLLQIARSCDAQLIAKGVETEVEWQALMDLGADAAIGYFLHRPSETIEG